MASSTALDILRISQKYSFYSTSIIFTIGIIGNLLNILIFISLKLFRNNQCVLYVVAESIANTFQLTIFFLIYLLPTLYGSDVAAASLFWCKFRAMMIALCSLISFSTICFSACDQYLSTNHRLYIRQLSTIKLARRLLCAALCLSLLHTIPFGVFLEIRTSSCTVYNPSMSNYLSYFYYLLLSGILPILIASVFSILAYRNVRRIVRRQVPIVRRRLDQQLTAMILVRIIVFVIFTSPYTIQRMYTYLAKVNQSDLLMYAINILFGATLITFFNLNYAASFYIFMITSSRFRRQVKYVLIKIYWRRWKGWCFGNGNQVIPMVDIRSAVSSEELG